MAQQSNLGQNGYDDASSGTLSYERGYFAITAVSAAQVDISNNHGDDSTDLPIPAGATIQVTASSITVDSGRILAYRNG